MAKLFGLPTPQEVRSQAHRQLFSPFVGKGAAGGAGALGAGLGLGLAKLFGAGESPEVMRAEKLQRIQSEVMQSLPEMTGQDSVFKVGETLANRLLKEGETELAMGIMEKIAPFKPEKADTEQKQINVLRKDVQSVTANIRDISESFRKMESASKRGTAQSDMAMIFTFMKILDPGSTVREGEFATAEQTTGIPGWITNLYNRAQSGERLGGEQRRNFLAEAKGLREASRASADEQIENILQQADQDKISRERVLGKQRLEAFQKRRTAKPKTTKPKTSSAAERLKKLKAGQ